MPHISIEYSANVGAHHDIDAVVERVHTAALGHGLPPLAGLRTRAIEVAQYRIADGQADHAYVAISARIGPGRDAGSKTRFLTAVLDAAQDSVATVASPLAIAWSIELVEIDSEFRINRNGVRERLTAQGIEPRPPS